MAQQEKKRKVRAVLAGGLVLGVGAVLTMAAWNSSEFATGSFATGAFVLEGKTPGEVSFGHHASEGDAASLDFSLDASNIGPGDTVSAGFAIRLDSATTFDGSAVIDTAVGDPVEGLRQRVYTSSTAECAGEAVLELVGPTALVGGSGSATADLLKGAADTAGETVNLCFEVTAGEEIAQNGASTAVWKIVATQKS
ncbi:hypothetical protein DQ353_09270 [Arthrobacter sp. AQ5-05]|uniref:SipW-dependent-type signal peptide-containing protein n=1 Tax=Arthrobacter sp. AQ5-05 TaxID=2184581 RepID=UPI000DCC9A21|nr:SipW-dependent-type signal peptide-containing protein [Arthrobacter sp. AQ5-05]RAX49462.1 hypothetical protein DQ353_09270 [Arthrobacter sp. AQ5-05]